MGLTGRVAKIHYIFFNIFHSGKSSYYKHEFPLLADITKRKMEK